MWQVAASADSLLLPSSYRYFGVKELRHQQFAEF
jgi:hypothetical protein